MLVVLDASAIVADFWMTGNAFRVLFGGSSRADLVLCLPDSVRDEVLNKFREKYLRLATDSESLVREATRLTGVSIFHTLPKRESTESAIRYYELRLLSLKVGETEFETLPYPAISHQQLALRAMARRKPFDEKGRGYRDALLWTAIIERLADSPEPIALVTANARDFALNGVLHPDLQEDLTVKGLPAGHVRLFESVAQLNETLVIPTLGRLDGLRDQVNSGQVPGSIMRWVENDLRGLLSDEDLGPLEHGHGRSYLWSVRTVGRLKVDAVRQIGSDQVLLAATARVVCELEVSATWDDFQKHQDVRLYFGDADSEPFSEISTTETVAVTVAFTLVLDQDDLRVISDDIDSYETEYGLKVDINPHRSDERTVPDAEATEQPLGP